MISVIDKQDREKLSEGRNFQLGFAFLKRTGESEFSTVQPISPCKDYLNDVVWAEALGKQVSAYGLTYDKQDIFTEGLGYMVIKICPSYQKLLEDTENLKKNNKNIELFINRMEELLKMEGRTTIEPCSLKDAFFLKLPMQWCKYTYAISLFSLLLRVSQWYNGEQDVVDYIENFNTFGQDVYLLSGCKPKILKLLELKEFPVQNLEILPGGVAVHNHGIKAFKLV